MAEKPTKKRKGDRRRNPAKGKNRTAGSFYTDFQKRIQVEEKIVETPEGLLEFVNADGHVVGRQIPPESAIALAERRGVPVDQVLKEHAENTLYAQMLEVIRMRRGLPAGTKISLRDPEVRRMFVEITEHGAYPYSEIVAKEIASRFSTGERLAHFLGKGIFPTYGTYIRWKSRYPDFKKMMEEAEKMRAERYVAEIEHVADHVDAGNSKAAKVRLDALKHLAAVHDPDRFGNRTKLVGDRNAPITFNVMTGVPDQEELPIPAQVEHNPPIATEGKVINDGSNSDSSDGLPGETAAVRSPQEAEEI